MVNGEVQTSQLTRQAIALMNSCCWGRDVKPNLPSRIEHKRAKQLFLIVITFQGANRFWKRNHGIEGG